MALFLISDDITLRARWMGLLLDLKPTTFAALDVELPDSGVAFVSDTLLKGMDEKSLQQLFGRRILVLSLMPVFEEAQYYLALGAMGYANAMMHESHLHSAYQAVEEGKVWLHPDFISLMIHQLQGNADKTKSTHNTLLAELSHREKEVALLLGDGHTHNEIAEQLGITVRTVKAHASAIYHKLGIKDRLALSLLLHS